MHGRNDDGSASMVSKPGTLLTLYMVLDPFGVCKLG